MVVDGLLNCSSEIVRANTCKLGERLARLGERAGHSQLLDMLSQQLGAADSQPYCCHDFYRLLTEIVHGMPTLGATVRPSFATCTLHCCWGVMSLFLVSLWKSHSSLSGRLALKQENHRK